MTKLVNRPFGYNLWKGTLQVLWPGDNLENHHYDYETFYNDNPQRAWDQLWRIVSNNQPHFPDEGESGLYKLPSHPTYPDLEEQSWQDNDTRFNISDRQLDEDTDIVLDYLGHDLGYNNGGTRVYYNNSMVLPTVYIRPFGPNKENRNYINLKRNKPDTGWEHKDRK